MSDDFLSGLRQEPSAEFAQQLKARLRRLDAPARRFVPSTLARWTALAASLGARGVLVHASRRCVPARRRFSISSA